MTDYYFSVFVHLLALSALKSVRNVYVVLGMLLNVSTLLKLVPKNGLYYSYLQSYEKEGTPYLISRF